MAAMQHPRITAAGMTGLLHAALLACWLQATPLGIETDGTGSGDSLLAEYVAFAADASIHETAPRDPDAPETPIDDGHARQRASGSPEATAPSEAIVLQTESFLDPDGSHTLAHDASATLPGNRPGDASANPQSQDADFHAVLRARIGATWLRLTNRPLPGNCSLSLVLQEGGVLVSANASGCSLAEADRNQLEAAALMSQPLPYEGYEAAFSPTLELRL